MLDSVPLHGDGQAPLPSTLRLGFAGATGSHVDKHEVDALQVWKPADLSRRARPARDRRGRRPRPVRPSRLGTPVRTPPTRARCTVDVPDGIQDVTLDVHRGGGLRLRDRDGER